MSTDLDDLGAPQGLSWSWELDFAALMAAISGDADGTDAASAGVSGASAPVASGLAPAAGSRTGAAALGLAAGDPDDPAVVGDPARPDDPARVGDPALPDRPDDLECPADRGGTSGQRLPAGVLAGRVAEHLAPGPDLAAWLAMAPPTSLPGDDLAAVAGSWRRVASWAAAQELAAVAQIAARAAARDEDVGTGPDGRPVRITASAAAEVALELTMSQYGAAGWADLAVTLAWRLPGTQAALTAGIIDLYRARLIAEATSMLTDEAARAVEDKVLPAAGDQTPGMLRAALRRAVIAADPRGAEDRRKESERRAKVVLYPDEEHTATLAGQRLPAVHAAAAMARIKAMARAMKASGAGGPLDLLSAQVYIGLLLGTLPPIPPAEDNPDGPAEPADPDSPADPDGPDDPADLGDPRDGGPGDDGPGEVPGAGVPPPGDADAPRYHEDEPGPADGGEARHGRDGGGPCDEDDGRPAWAWPDLPAVIPPAFAHPAARRPADGRPVPGLLDLSVPWQVLAGTSESPGHLGRIGPVTAAQARQLAGCAARDPAAEWRIIITSPAGHAIAVTRIPRPRGRDRPPRPVGGATATSGGYGRDADACAMADGTGTSTATRAGSGLVGRVTLTIPEDLLAHPPPLPPEPEPCTGRRPSPGSIPGPDPPGPAPGPDALGPILRRALQAADRAAARARAAAAADAAAGGCAHTLASPGYRPPPRLRDYITARDRTCRNPRCRQPAWRGDLDHTIPFDDGGLTCSCNLGAFCRTDHLLKHHPGWKVRQTAPGTFSWTTPSGRTFTTTPDTYPA